MKITIAPDSLKESISATDAAQAIERGLLRVCPGLTTVCVPIADGGEGTTQAIVESTGGTYHNLTVSGPLGRPADAMWGLCGDGRTAVVEMAEASGLALLRPAERDPMLTSTRGTGELLRAALDADVESIVVGIGGSATVDGGTGMAAELGVQFLDHTGAPIEDCRGGRLADIHSIDMCGLDPRIRDVRVVVACDVTNPLTGPEGAARVYGPQKGADVAAVEELERGLTNLGRVIKECLGVDVVSRPGAGAAGGLGAGLVAFLGAELRSGVETVAEAVGLREKMAGADLAITAEGRLDGQSTFGKATAGVIACAHELGVPVVVLAGSLGDGYQALHQGGMCAAFSIVDGPMSLEEAFAEAGDLLERTAESVMRLWLAGKGSANGGA
jgi:glycerate kinase